MMITWYGNIFLPMGRSFDWEIFWDFYLWRVFLLIPTWLHIKCQSSWWSFSSCQIIGTPNIMMFGVSLLHMFSVDVTCIIRHSRFTLVANFNTEVWKIPADCSACNRLLSAIIGCNRVSPIFQYVFITDVTTDIRVVKTTTEVHSHYEIIR